jgi:hypothetical protein
VTIYLSIITACLGISKVKFETVLKIKTVKPATQEVDIRRTTVQGQPREKDSKSSSQPIAVRGSTGLSSQPCGKCKKENCGPN